VTRYILTELTVILRLWARFPTEASDLSWDYRAFGLCPSSGILKCTSVSVTGSVSVLTLGCGTHLLSVGSVRKSQTQ
jgi:hypothetical protein